MGKAAFLFGGPGEKFVSLIVQDVSKIQFLAVTALDLELLESAHHFLPFDPLSSPTTWQFAFPR